MPNVNMYVTVKRVNPERLRCPVKDCQAEGKEENRVDTPFISGLGPMTVYLCDAHAAVLAVMFLDKNAEVDVIQWDEKQTAEEMSFPPDCAVDTCKNVAQVSRLILIQRHGLIPALRIYLCHSCYREYAQEIRLEHENPVPLPGPIELPAHPGEAGALYAFMGWLTTREEVSGPFSRSHDTSGSGSLVKQFIDMQGWPDPPDGWHHCIKPFEEEKEALGRAHLENYRTSLEKSAHALIENYAQAREDITSITYREA